MGNSIIEAQIEFQEQRDKFERERDRQIEEYVNRVYLKMFSPLEAKTKYVHSSTVKS